MSAFVSNADIMPFLYFADSMLLAFFFARLICFIIFCKILSPEALEAIKQLKLPIPPLYDNELYTAYREGKVGIKYVVWQLSLPVILLLGITISYYIMGVLKDAFDVPWEEFKNRL